MNKRKPFTGMAFIFLVLSITSFAQSSSKYIKSSSTPTGQLHFIKPIEFKGEGSDGFIIDISVTQTGTIIDSAVANFTFTTRTPEPRLDSIQINCDGKLLSHLPLSTYYVEKKGRDWISRNGVLLNADQLKILLDSKQTIVLLFPRGVKTPVIFNPSDDWIKMSEIASVILFP